MNLLLDDTRLQPNQYRVGFNVRNRYDVLDEVRNSTVDPAAPSGLKQELVTFGNFLILFVAGSAYYRYYTDTGWKQVMGFNMSTTAPRYWTKAIPVAATNYVRLSDISETGGPDSVFVPNPAKPVILNNIAGANAGNLPGLVVQDNINQPRFIFIDLATGMPTCRVTQTFAQWTITFTDDTNTIILLDDREYVPVGNVMEWIDGILYITSQDQNFIYRSVSGRPLDFVVNVNPDGTAGGDATTTSYSVGVGGITCLRAMSNNALFVAASNANFSVAKNMTQNAPLLFGEYTFIRTFLFNATCLSDRAIIDSLGDTRFIDLTGVRSFNAVLQEQNEGRNSQFTATVAAAFTGMVQTTAQAAAILYDNYEFYAVNTIFGPAIAVFDTLSGCWTSFDTSQTGGLIKQLAKIELTVQRLYAIGADDQLYTLYSGNDFATASVRTIACSANMLSADQQNIKQNNPKSEVKLNEIRIIYNRITRDMVSTVTPFVNNQLTQFGTGVKAIQYTPPPTPYVGHLTLPDVDTQLSNVLYSITDAEQGWKTFVIISWTGGATLTQFSFELEDLTPMNPLNSQIDTQ